jgi:peptide-methionine (S)-S-oxide reductase
MPDNQLKTAVFANGCFWCTEAVFSMLKGVKSVMSGYTSNPPAESLKIEYDPDVISYDDLLAVFFNTHDPTTLNRQGNDVGTQYRSAIFYADDEQKTKAERLIREFNDLHAYDKPVVTEVTPLAEFRQAEHYHHDYYKNNPTQPYCQLIIAPKLEKTRKRFAKLLKA